VNCEIGNQDGNQELYRKEAQRVRMRARAVEGRGGERNKKKPLSPK